MGNQSSTPTPSVQVGSRTPSGYDIKPMYVHKRKHPGIPHPTANGLWTKMPHDVVYLPGFGQGQDITKFRSGSKSIDSTIIRFVKPNNCHIQVYVKVHLPNTHYEYDKLDLVDFQHDDWAKIWKYTVYD